MTEAKQPKFPHLHFSLDVKNRDIPKEYVLGHYFWYICDRLQDAGHNEFADILLAHAKTERSDPDESIGFVLQYEPDDQHFLLWALSLMVDLEFWGCEHSISCRLFMIIDEHTFIQMYSESTPLATH